MPERVEVGVARAVGAGVEGDEGLVGEIADGSQRRAHQEQARDREQDRAVGWRRAVRAAGVGEVEFGVGGGHRAVDGGVLAGHVGGGGGAQHRQVAVGHRHVGGVAQHLGRRFLVGSRQRRLVALGPLRDLVHEPEHVHLVEGRVLDLDAVGVDGVGEHLLQPFQSQRPPGARVGHVGEVVGQQQQRRPLVEAVVEVGLEVPRFGEEPTELLQRAGQAGFEVGRERVRDLQLHVEVDQLHRAVGGGVVVVEGDRVFRTSRVVGDVRAQDRDQLFQVGGPAGRLPLVQQGRLRTEPVEVELPIRFVVGVLFPGERPGEVGQRETSRRPHVFEQILRGGFFALVQFGVHALLAERQRGGIDGGVVDGDRHLRHHRRRGTRPPQLHAHRVRPVGLRARVPRVLVGGFGHLGVAVLPVHVELDAVGRETVDGGPDRHVAAHRRPFAGAFDRGQRDVPVPVVDRPFALAFGARGVRRAGRGRAVAVSVSPRSASTGV